MTDLCLAGPIQAVEIQVESPSPANMCMAHHAVIRRMQVRQPTGLLGGLYEVVGQDLGGLWLLAWGLQPSLPTSLCFQMHVSYR